MTRPRDDIASEADIQRAVVEHLRWRAHPEVVWWACPNGGYRSRVEGAIFKGLGVTAGVSDLNFVHAGRFYALELKTLRGRLTEAQGVFIERINAQGCTAKCAYGIDEALAALTAWGLLRR